MPRAKKKKLKMKLPPPRTEKATLTPKFLNVFRVPSSRTSTGPKTKVAKPSPSDKVPHLPKLLHSSPGSPPPSLKLPRSRSKIDRYPHLARLTKAFKSLLLKVQPDKPVRMPRFPTLGFPPLYTRYAIMKTYTAVTDSNGQITVTFPRVFRKIPGVVLTPNDPGTWFTHVLSKDQFGFTVQILKTVHSHQHDDSGDSGGHAHGGGSGGGGTHVHVIYTSGVHWHTVGGAITCTYDIAVTWVSSPTVGAGAHKHTNPSTTTPSSIAYAIYDLALGDACETSGYCIANALVTEVASSIHTHSQPDTGNEPDHGHNINQSGAYFVKSVDDVTAWTTSQHDGHDHPEDDAGYHYHDIAYESAHHHVVPDSNEKEASALISTSVTFTYFAQEET